MNQINSILNNETSATQFMPDGWDRPIRLGVVVPHADVGPEAELSALAGNDVSIHGARLFFSAMRAGGEMDEKIPHDPIADFAKPPVLDELIEGLSQSPLNAIALAFTSSAYKHGPDGEKALIERLAHRAHDTVITTTCLAAVAAFKALEAKRIALVNPPWFDDALSSSGAKYFIEQGFNVVHHGPAGLKSGQRYITPEGLFDWVGHVAQSTGADTIFIAGNGQRAVGIIDAVEKAFGVTLLTANQLVFWHALKLAGFDVQRSGYGRLLA
jgi:maleate isomerase